MGNHEYSHGVCGDGAAVLKDGHPMTIEEIVSELRQRQDDRAQGGQEVEPVGIVNYADHQSADALVLGAPLRMAVDETSPRSIQGLPKGTKLYTQPPPAQQGSVPDELREKALELCRAVENEEEFPPAKFALRCLMLVNQVRKLAATPHPEGDGCEWHSDDNGCWMSQCGKEWYFEDGGPEDNGCYPRLLRRSLNDE